MENSREVYDVVVVGAGIEGSATAYHLAKSGKHVLLVDQFPLPHSRGSSHGQSRITRKAYGPQDFYTRMMDEAYRLTEVLQAECGEQLFIKCGTLVFGRYDDPFTVGTEDCLRRFNVPFEKFGSAEQRRRYPGMEFPKDFTFVLDKTGGVLRADKMLQAFQKQFVRYGGVLVDGEPMKELLPGEIVTVRTPRRMFRGRSVVLALGPWAANFLPTIGVDIPLQPQRIAVYYWRSNETGRFDTATFPTIITENATQRDQCIYGLPAEEYPGLVKICLHTGPDVDPDRRDAVDSRWVEDRMRAIIAQNFPGLDPTPAVTETCIYTMTPDHDPVLDHHPAWKNIVIAAGFSGHGFKLSPVVGKVLSQLATGQTPEYDMSHFRLARFHKHKL
ncbi:peroxisomal sarcosine oxidase-like isoform X2 [Mya arenaria]|uniref:peroxisomal sarcosine oxidase-like isoform X2 n=1 Tax=Mya arenaria TaxID=6604 RepID=UPI0022E359C3|nr:peroxisomal sarcosine oxidase-like isoform X2 [Mya arenaria]